jgi:hypothetical protein
MHRTLQDILWLAPPTLELAIATAMFWQRTWREYPVFWTYLLSEVARTALLFTIGNDKPHYTTYFWIYWVTELLICLLGFFVVAEVFDRAFSERLGLRQWGRSIFWLTLLLLLVFGLFTANATQGTDSSKLIAGILVLKRAESLVRLGLIAGLVAFVFLLGLPWSNHTVGIAIGFALYGAVELAVMAIRMHYGPTANRSAMWILMSAGLCENLVWAAYFFPRQLSPVSSTSGLVSNDRHAATDELERVQVAIEILLER